MYMWYDGEEGTRGIKEIGLQKNNAKAFSGVAKRYVRFASRSKTSLDRKKMASFATRNKNAEKIRKRKSDKVRTPNLGD